MRKTFFLSLLVVMTLAFSTLSVKAETNSTEPGAASGTTTGTNVRSTTTLKENSETLKTDRQQLTQDRCTLVTQRIDTIISGYQKNKTDQANIFVQLRARAALVITKMQSRGADVSALQADLQTLNQKIDKLNSDATAVMTQLSATKQYACGQSEGQFKAAYEQARSLMKVVADDITDLKTFYTTKLKPDFQAAEKTMRPLTSPRPVGSPRPISGSNDHEPSRATTSAARRFIQPTAPVEGTK